MNLSSRGQLFITAVSAVGLQVPGPLHRRRVTGARSPRVADSGGAHTAERLVYIRIPSLAARFSVSETFVFTSVLLFGPSAGTITLALDALIAALGSANRRQPVRILFNLAAASLSIWLASQVFYKVSGIRPLIGDQPSSCRSSLAPRPSDPDLFPYQQLLGSTGNRVRAECWLVWSLEEELSVARRELFHRCVRCSAARLVHSNSRLRFARHHRSPASDYISHVQKSHWVE